jgi:hypothetical protein
VPQLIGLAAKNLSDVISKLEERIEGHRGKITFDHFPPPTRCQHKLVATAENELDGEQAEACLYHIVIASGLLISSGGAVVSPTD